MSDLSFAEKAKIESLLGMKSGYVLDFSDRTFRDFFGEALEVDIFSEKYNKNTGSKANRLRAFFVKEPNHIVGILLEKLLEYWLAKAQIGDIDYYSEEDVYKDCLKIVERLKNGNIVEHLDVIKPISDEKEFSLLAKSIKESIEKNEPELALDRLHTYLFQFIKDLCNKHLINYEKSESLNSVFGKYIKHLKNSNLIESLMAEKILKYSINIIEAFNDIRNNKSFAHDNSILNYEESILILNNLVQTIKFIQYIENKNNLIDTETESVDYEDLPF